MSALVILGIGALGGLGAIARFLVDGAVADRVATSFPIGTLVVNLTGAFAVGVLAGATTNDAVIHLAATGLVGSYTTFSTWMLESQRLSEDGEFALATVNFVASSILGLAVAWIGIQIGAVV